VYDSILSLLLAPRRASWLFQITTFLCFLRIYETRRVVPFRIQSRSHLTVSSLRWEFFSRRLMFGGSMKVEAMAHVQPKSVTSRYESRGDGSSACLFNVLLHLISFVKFCKRSILLSAATPLAHPCLGCAKGKRSHGSKANSTFWEE
jgi:hypothetical protein